MKIKITKLPSNTKSLGGVIETHGSDFTNGLMEIREGGTHEENPLDGVPMGLDPQGIPNLVEEGETVYNDYVFSDRMQVPYFMYKELGLGGAMKKKGKGMSFADASKKLAQESEQRPNDPISQAGLEASLSKLAEVQETERARKNMEEYVGLGYACGGNMKKYGLGGNMYDFGGALRWLQEHYPKMGNKNEVAKILNKRAKAVGYRGTNTNDKVYDYEGTLKSMMATNKPLGEDNEKLFESLVSDGMDRKVAFGLAYPMELSYPYGGDNYGKSHRTAREAAYKKYITDYTAPKEAQKQAQSSAKRVEAASQVPQTVGAGTNKSYSLASVQQQARSQAPAVTSTPASTAQGSSGGAGNRSGSATKAVPAGSSSDFRFGKGVSESTKGSILDAIAFNPPTEGIRESAQQPVITDDVRKGIAMDGYTPEIRPEDAGLMGMLTNETQQEKVPQYATWMRYAPALGAGLMATTDLLGLTNKPDYTYADKIEAAANGAGYAPHIEAEPIGNYLTYRPMDIWYEQNALNAQSRATDRALLNSSSPSRAAGLLANGYNSQLASGNLYRQALEYNDAKRQAVEDFNRRTNMFNSQMKLEADMANARYHQQAQQFGLSGLAQAAALRDQIDARTGAARAANLSNLFTSLGNIGRENFAMNQINNDRSRRYYGTLSGQSGYKQSGAAYGGKIKKRK